MGKILAGFGRIGLWPVIWLLFGCVGQTLILPLPHWHLMGSGAYDTDQGKAFYGVGKASGIRSRTLLRATADNNARAEMAVLLERYVDQLAQVALPDSGQSALAVHHDERAQVLGSLVRKALQHAVISDHWSESQQDRFFALCRLDLASFKQALNDFRLLVPEDRAAMQANAEALHSRLVPIQ